MAESVAPISYLSVTPENIEDLLTTKYDINEDGLFVIIINDRFGYVDRASYPPETIRPRTLRPEDSEEEAKIWYKIIPDHYRDDRLLLGMNLMPDRLDQVDPQPIDPRLNAENSGANGTSGDMDDQQDKYFEQFMSEIEEKVREKKPSFIFVSVSSHGGEDCTFLLAAHRKDKEGMCSPKCQGRHCYQTLQQYRDNETSNGHKQCHKRSFDVLISKIQNMQHDGERLMVGKPKIFIADFCRSPRTVEKLKQPPNPAFLNDEGERRKIRKLSATTPDGSTHPTIRMVHMASGADTIILYATLENNAALSFELLRYLRDSVLRLKECSENHEQHLKGCLKETDLQSLRDHLNEIKKSEEARTPHTPQLQRLEVEDLVRGWLPNVFEDVCHGVSLKLRIRIKEMVVFVADPDAENFALPEEHEIYVKQVPEMSSTLNRRLSALDIFRDRTEAIGEENDPQITEDENHPVLATDSQAGSQTL